MTNRGKRGIVAEVSNKYFYANLLLMRIGVLKNYKSTTFLELLLHLLATITTRQQLHNELNSKRTK